MKKYLSSLVTQVRKLQTLRFSAFLLVEEFAAGRAAIRPKEVRSEVETFGKTNRNPVLQDFTVAHYMSKIRKQWQKLTMHLHRKSANTRCKNIYRC